MKYLLAVSAMLFGLVAPSRAQTGPIAVHFGADLVSRYVVRGLSFGQSPSIQPSAAVTAAGFDLGTWGNYSLTGTDAANGTEQDFWIGYTVSASHAGTARISLFDFHFPDAGDGFFDTRNDGRGSHFLEAQLRLSPSRLPLYFFAGHHVYNDPDGSWYAEVGLTPRLGELQLSLAAGIAGAESGWYGTSGKGISLINTSLRLSRHLQLTESFALPLHGEFVLNPETRRAHFVFGLSL